MKFSKVLFGLRCLRTSSASRLLLLLVISPCLFQDLVGQDIRTTRLDNGLVQLESVYLRLVTDMPMSDAIEALPRAFDQAIEQWCTWFNVERERANGVKPTAYLMLDRSRFIQLKLMPAEVSNLRHGYQFDDHLYVTEQPSDYYRRHLLLHEGTHWFLWKFLNGNGRPWLDEGICELLGTHRWDGEKLVMGVIPENRDRFPLWGRLKLIRESLERNTAPRLQDIFHYDGSTHRTDEPYAWSWAAVLFFTNHARYRSVFQKTGFQQISESTSTYSDQVEAELKRQLADVWPMVEAEWRIFLTELDYGFSPSHSMIDLKALPWKALEQREIRTIRGDRGWQSTGIFVKLGQQVRIRAKGEIVVRSGPTGGSTSDWISEPQGITLEYVRGEPRGKLIAAIVPIDETEADKRVLRLSAIPIGSSAAWSAEQHGLLLLKINESSSGLFDNQGEFTVAVEPDAS